MTAPLLLAVPTVPQSFANDSAILPIHSPPYLVTNAASRMFKLLRGSASMTRRILYLHRIKESIANP